MIEITPELRAELRRKATAAPPGPWEPGAVERDIVWAPLLPGQLDVGATGRWVVARANMHVPGTQAIAAYIAAANPAIVLALLDKIDALETQLDYERMGGYL